MAGMDRRGTRRVVPPVVAHSRRRLAAGRAVRCNVFAPPAWCARPKMLVRRLRGRRQERAGAAGSDRRGGDRSGVVVGAGRRTQSWISGRSRLPITHQPRVQPMSRSGVGEPAVAVERERSSGRTRLRPLCAAHAPDQGRLNPARPVEAQLLAAYAVDLMPDASVRLSAAKNGPRRGRAGDCSWRWPSRQWCSSPRRPTCSDVRPPQSEPLPGQQRPRRRTVGIHSYSGRSRGTAIRSKRSRTREHGSSGHGETRRSARRTHVDTRPEGINRARRSAYVLVGYLPR